MTKQNLRSVLAILAGIGVTVGLSLLTDVVMQTLSWFPPFGQPMTDVDCIIATAYRVAYGVLGAYVIARLAPNWPMRHAMVLGALGLIASIAGAAATWDAMPTLGPRWYPLALVATALPCAWAGGKLYRKCD